MDTADKLQDRQNTVHRPFSLCGVHSSILFQGQSKKKKSRKCTKKSEERETEMWCNQLYHCLQNRGWTMKLLFPQDIPWTTEESFRSSLIPYSYVREENTWKSWYSRNTVYGCGLDWTESGLGPVAGFCEHGIEPSVFIKCREFNCLSDYWLPKKNSARWS
jgi:hypothetical protein